MLEQIMVDGPVTEAQAKICELLGFLPPDRPLSGWFTDSFGDIWIKDLPYVPAINELLKAQGFRWEAWRKAWRGQDATRAQVELLQAFSFCSRRNYLAETMPAGGSAPAFASDSYPGASYKCCPLRVGVFEERD